MVSRDGIACNLSIKLLFQSLEPLTSQARAPSLHRTGVAPVTRRPLWRRRMSEQHTLRANVLGAADTAMMAVAGSAPAYSIGASTAALVAVAGLGSPAALLWCGIPMLGIAWAFSHLGRTEVN